MAQRDTLGAVNEWKVEEGKALKKSFKFMWQNRRVSNAKTVCNRLRCRDVQRRIILADIRFIGPLVSL
jgi:hypothetical protein